MVENQVPENKFYLCYQQQTINLNRYLKVLYQAIPTDGSIGLLLQSMIDKIDIIKGIHPGLLVDRELNKRKIRKSQFADTIAEHPQTLTAITKGKRRMNIPLSLKIEKGF